MKRTGLVIAAIACCSLASAQETRGTIQGTVKDPTGGVIPAATVVVTNAGTNVPVNLKTDENGFFRAPLLLPGEYSVSIEAAGFKKSVRSGIVLQLSDVRDLGIALQLARSRKRLRRLPTRP